MNISVIFKPRTYRYIFGKLFVQLGCCYYCWHPNGRHLPGRVRECKTGKCDCFAFDTGPRRFAER